MTIETKPKQSTKFILAAQTLAGLSAAYLVTPFNVVVDKSVILYSNGRSGLWQSVGIELKSMFKTPRIFLTSFEFKWMYFVYMCTYSVSNLMDHVNVTPDISHSIQKLLAVFVTNTTCSIIKDKIYAQHFGKTAIRPFPNASIGLFFARDILAMASAFTLPPILGKIISQKYGISNVNGQRIAQIACPVLLQTIVTPIQLLALDLYNREHQNIASRIASIKKLYTNTLLIRMLRFLPAYGLGGIANIQLRKWLKSKIPNE